LTHITKPRYKHKHRCANLIFFLYDQIINRLYSELVIDGPTQLNERDNDLPLCRSHSTKKMFMRRLIRDTVFISFSIEWNRPILFVPLYKLGFSIKNRVPNNNYCVALYSYLIVIFVDKIIIIYYATVPNIVGDA